MIYVLKALTSFLLPPGLFIVLMTLIGAWFYYRKQRKAAFAMFIVTCLLYLASTPLIGEGALQSLENRYEPPAVIEGDVYVVLTGGAVQGTPNPSGTGSPNVYTLSRLVTALELYKKKRLPILISGGQVYENSENEGRVSKRKLMALGVPEADILLEDRSRTTQENAQNSKVILEQHSFKRPILITSAFHMARSVKHFHEQKVGVIPYPAAYMVSRDSSFQARDLFPSSTALDWLSLAMKEYLGMLQ